MNRNQWDLEALLRSPWKRFALATLLVVALAAFNTGHLHEMFQARRFEVDWQRLFAQQLLVYGTWALAGWPLFRLAQWLRHLRPSWLLFFAIQIPLSVGVAAGATLLHDELQERMIAPSRAERESVAQSEGLPPQAGEEQPDRPSGARRSQRGGPRGFGSGRDGGRARLFFVTRTRNNIAIYWMVLGVGAIASTFLRSRDRERLASDLHLRSSQLQTELARAQLGSLRDQLRPHFIFNALHTVSGLVQQEKGPEATRVLIALGDLLRNSLDYGDRQEVSLREELKVAESYMDVERVRFGERLAVSIEVDDDCLDAQVPALLLQPLLENSVRHGISPRMEGGRISVKAHRNGDVLQLEVRDDGPGFPEELLGAARTARSEGGRRNIGLTNVRERVRLLYGEDQGFVLSNDPAGGAVITIDIPFRTEVRVD